jgi:hypothetical protein
MTGVGLLLIGISIGIVLGMVLDELLRTVVLPWVLRNGGR